ncbi:hypothetical protein B0H10DRAFT_2436135 [Mycena sp. CBHHK59/15]|nr:hypothetical protein B0H10DRAFT_2436135 [Mycena sp. CBHHK59/15]
MVSELVEKQAGLFSVCRITKPAMLSGVAPLRDRQTRATQSSYTIKHWLLVPPPVVAMPSESNCMCEPRHRRPPPPSIKSAASWSRRSLPQCRSVPSCTLFDGPQSSSRLPLKPSWPMRGSRIIWQLLRSLS